MTVKFNCWAETESFMNSPESSHHRLLLQYSVNGGITWILVQVKPSLIDDLIRQDETLFHFQGSKNAAATRSSARDRQLDENPGSYEFHTTPIVAAYSRW